LKPPMVAIQWSGSSWLPALKEIGISQDSLDTIVIQWFIGIYNNHYKDPYCGWDDHQPYSEYWPWLRWLGVNINEHWDLPMKNGGLAMEIPRPSVATHNKWYVLPVLPHCFSTFTSFWGIWRV
jgi:hypothetical protein